MICPADQLEIRLLPTSKLIVRENQKRFPQRLFHYIALMLKPENEERYPGVVSVKPMDDGYYEVLDGHHRFVSHIIVGRDEVLCLVHIPSTVDQRPFWRRAISSTDVKVA